MRKRHELLVVTDPRGRPRGARGRVAALAGLELAWNGAARTSSCSATMTVHATSGLLVCAY